MNRKLKNMLKNTYSAEPNRKYSFIQQLQSNPVWQKLHPISSAVRLSPAFSLIFATLAVIAVGTGIIAYNFNEEEPPLPDIPPIVTETTATAATVQETTTETTVTTYVTAESTITTIATKTTRVTASVTAVTSTAKNTTTAVTSAEIQPSKTIIETTSTQTTVITTDIQTTTPTTSIYYTHLFSHDYKLTSDSDETILYGYPNYNFSEDWLRLIFERKNPDKDFDELVAEYLPNATTADFTEILMSSFTAFFREQTIIEGETTDIEYIAYEGKPWTVCEITVSKVYSFEILNKPINKGDKINIAMPGGYMPVSEYIELNPNDTLFSGWTEEQINSTVIYEDGSNQNEPKTGDKYTYFIEEPELDIPVENLYTRIAICDIMQFKTDGDNLISCNSHFSDCAIEKSTIEREDEYYYYRDPNSDRCLAFLDNSFLLCGQFYCYSVDSDGRITYLDDCFTDDGFFPFSDYDYENNKSIPCETTTETDEQGRTVLRAKDFSITWTDTGAIIEYNIGTLEDYYDKIEVTIN